MEFPRIWKMMNSQKESVAFWKPTAAAISRPTQPKTIIRYFRFLSMRSETAPNSGAMMPAAEQIDPMRAAMDWFIPIPVWKKSTLKVTKQ